MMPFFGMGEDHRADSWLGDVATVDKEKLNGDGGAVNQMLNIKIHCDNKCNNSAVCGLCQMIFQ